ncbi:hypothetical protein [Pseudooceanicola sp.]|uniref:hypothetical protein n=1 Tax=Pseudooceanicola sp. TaxID=1914328 RepID=UPI00405936F4
MQRMHVLSLAMMSAVAFAPAASAQVGVDANVSLGGGSVADADVAVSLGGGSAADADVNASAGGGTGADAGVGATVGGGSVADVGVDATVGGGSGTVAGAGVTAGGTTGSRGTGTGTGTGTQTAGGTNTTQDGDPQLVGRDLIGTDGVRLGVIAQVTRTMICTSDQRCLAYSTRPVLTAEGVLVNVSSDVFLR